MPFMELLRYEDSRNLDIQHRWNEKGLNFTKKPPLSFLTAHIFNLVYVQSFSDQIKMMHSGLEKLGFLVHERLCS